MLQQLRRWGRKSIFKMLQESSNERRYLKKYSLSGLSMETHKIAREYLCVAGVGSGSNRGFFWCDTAYSLQLLLNFVDGAFVTASP